jgi:hypothetical protein
MQDKPNDVYRFRDGCRKDDYQLMQRDPQYRGGEAWMQERQRRFNEVWRLVLRDNIPEDSAAKKLGFGDDWG